MKLCHSPGNFVSIFCGLQMSENSVESKTVSGSADAPAPAYREALPKIKVVDEKVVEEVCLRVC